MFLGLWVCILWITFQKRIEWKQNNESRSNPFWHELYDPYWSLIGGAAAQIVPHHSFLPFQPPLSPTLLLICLLQGQFNLNLESYMYSQAPSQCWCRSFYFLLFPGTKFLVESNSVLENSSSLCLKSPQQPFFTASTLTSCSPFDIFTIISGLTCLQE